MQTIYSSLKVNNEIELCEIANEECKKRVEKALLENRISYFIRWQRRTLFNRKGSCTICVHEDVRETAAELVQVVCDEMDVQVKFIARKPKNSYL